MKGRHEYRIEVRWDGNTGTGTSGYREYSRAHVISRAGKPEIPGSSDPGFRGDAARWNPEELLVASLSTCHQLWYLHLCAEAGVVVVAYADHAVGLMEETADSGGRFVDVLLRPVVHLGAGSDGERARDLHHEAHAKCFIASSVNFPVRCEAEIVVHPSPGIRTEF